MVDTPYDLGQYIFIPSSDTNTIGVGATALDSVTTGTNNVALGAKAGTQITTGSNNLLIGPSVASTTLATGSNNIVIGTSSAADTGSASSANTLWIGGGATSVIQATGINGTPTVTIPGALTVNGALTHTGGSVQAPTAVGATLTVTPAMAGSTILLDTAAGSVATLPAASGSGAVYRFVVKTTATSNAHKILAASVSDFVNGNATGHTAAGATLTFSAAAATAHSIQMPFAGTQPSGGFIGDWFEFRDIAANLWTVSGQYQAGTTATTPFSSATS